MFFFLFVSFFERNLSYSVLKGQGVKDKVPMDVLIKRYRESEVNGLALLHQLAQSLELHLELKETGTSGKLLQLISALKIFHRFISLSLRSKPTPTCGQYTFLEVRRSSETCMFIFKFKHFAFHYSAHIFQTFTSQALKLGFPLFGLSVSTKILFNQAQDFPQNIFPLCFQTTYHICVLPFVP